MPELPEVESYRRYFEHHALGQEIVSVSVQDRGVLAKRTSAARLRRELQGQKFDRVTRHGKNLFARVSGGGWLRIHFGMTGDLSYFHHPHDETPRFARIVFRFPGGALAYQDARKFGRVELIGTPEDYLRDQGMGPDPLSEEFKVHEFVKRMAKRRGAIKPLMLNQRVLAGIGNLYADEALFQAGVHPLARVERLSAERLTRVFRVLNTVLRKIITIQAKDDRYPRKFLLPRRGEGQRCPRCGGVIARATVAGRTTYFCRRHQRK